jgi:hypothetical protein
MPILTQFIDDLGLLSQQTNHRTMKVETERIKMKTLLLLESCLLILAGRTYT